MSIFAQHVAGMHDGNQHAVITGGSGSLGKAIAAALQTPRWTVEALSRRDLDVSKQDEIDHFFASRSVDLLVCAAGVTFDRLFARLSEKTWDETWAVNFTGAALCADAVLPKMGANQSGHIVFISSFSAIHPPMGQAAYATAKAALLGLVADLANRHGSSNVRVNAIVPGFLETPMTDSVTATRRSQILTDHTLGRFNTCHEVANFIHFLHHHLPHTSGQMFQLDSRVGTL